MSTDKGMKHRFALTTPQRAEIRHSFGNGRHGDHRRKSWFLYVFAASVFGLACGGDTTTAPVVVGEPQFAMGGGTPHFAGVKADLDDFGQLVISFKVVGARDEVGANVTAKAESTADYACFFPSVTGSSLSTETVGTAGLTETVSSTGFFGRDADGRIAGSLTLLPASHIIRCPEGSTVVITSVSFTNVELTSSAVATKLVSGTFTRTWTY